MSMMRLRNEAKSIATGVIGKRMSSSLITPNLKTLSLISVTKLASSAPPE